MPLKNDWANGDTFTPAAANDMANIVNNAGTRTAFNVKDYGAVGDGTTNDRAAIHAARDAAGVGGRLFFPKGTYRIEMLSSSASGYKYGSGGLHANTAGQTWDLGSAELVLIGSQQENLITISAPNVSIIGGTLNLSAVADAQYFNAGIAVWSATVATGVVYGTHGSNAAGAAIRNVTIKDASSHGIHILNTNSVIVTGCTMTDFYSVGIFVQTTDATADIYDFLIHGNKFESSSAYATPLYIGANDQPADNFDTAIRRVRRARITDNSCVISRSFVPSGPELGAIQMMNAEDCVIDGNVTDGGAFGITTGFLRRTVISNNTCTGWRGIGIEVAGGLDRVAITGNVIDSDGAGGPFDATTGAQDAGGASKQTIIGISSSGTKNFRNYIIAGNTITGFTTAARTSGVQLFNTSRPSAGGSFENVTISGNNITADGGSANFSALSIFAPTTNLTVNGNSIDGSSRTPSTGVNVAEGSHTGMSITGNNLSNLASAATNLSGTFTDVRFTGNTVRNCTTALTGSGVASATRLVVDSTTPSTSTATAAGTTTLTADSTEVQVFTGSTTQTVRLATTNVLAGRRFTVVNASTGSVTVQSSDASTLQTVNPGNSATFVALQSTPTTVAHWQQTAIAGADVLLLGGALGTPSSATLTNASGLPVSGITASTSTALGVGSVELGHASDTTLSRSSAGVLAVEGVPVVTTSATQTLTSKTLTSPTMTSPKIDGGAGSGSLEVSGSATDQNLNIYCKGAGVVALQSLSHGNILRAVATASAVNYLSVTSQVAGTAPSISSAGTDTNINLNLQPKGSGVVTANNVAVSTNSTTSTHIAQQIELGNATDTTLSRSSAGVLAVEGVDVVLTGGALGTPSSGNLANCTLPASAITVSAATVGQNYFTPGYVSGNYYFCNSLQLTSSGALTNGVVRVSPWVVTASITVTRLFAEFTVAGDAASVFRLGIWNHDPTTGKPSTLVLDAGSISTGTGNAGTVATGGTPGVYEITISQALSPGLYWVGGVTQGVTATQPTIRTCVSTSVPLYCPLGTSLPTAGAIQGSWILTSVTGALGSLAAATVSAINPARIGFKVA